MLKILPVSALDPTPLISSFQFLNSTGTGIFFLVSNFFKILPVLALAPTPLISSFRFLNSTGTGIGSEKNVAIFLRSLKKRAFFKKNTRSLKKTRVL